MIDHLLTIKDLLVNLFKDNELRSIKDNSVYHSPEVFKTDDENTSGRRKIITKDLK